MGRRRGKRWIQRAIKRPGRVRRYLRRKYGRKAFNRDGSIKASYLDRAIREVKRRGGNRSLLSALILARRLKRGID